MITAARRVRRGYTGGVRSGPVAAGALLGAIAGATLGAYFQKLRASNPIGEDEQELLRRLSKLEAEVEELEFRQREHRRKATSAPSARPAQPVRSSQSATHPRPFLELRGKSPQQQYLVLTADRDFRLSRVDYVSSQGKTVISEDVEKSGSRIEVPINEKKVSRVWYLRPRMNEAPTRFQFRCHLRLDGVETESVVPAVIQQNYVQVGPARTIFRNVTLVQ
jgi:hypothetical protein